MVDLDLREIALYAPTRSELCRTMGTGDVREAIGLALATGPRMGSTLGAGDVFHGALVALVWAKAAAALACRGGGGVSGAPGGRELSGSYCVVSL